MRDNLICRDKLWNPMQMKYWPQRRFERHWMNCRLIIMHVTKVECTEPHSAPRSLHCMMNCSFHLRLTKKTPSKCAVLWKERQQYACTQSKIIKIIRKKNCPLFLCRSKVKPDFTANRRCRLFSSDITSASMVCLLNCFTCPRAIILCLGICPWRL